MGLYRVGCTGKNPLGDGPLYWSNDIGWVSKGSADIFTEEERNSLNLPIEGKWVKVRDKVR